VGLAWARLNLGWVRGGEELVGGSGAARCVPAEMGKQPGSESGEVGPWRGEGRQVLQQLSPPRYCNRVSLTPSQRRRWPHSRRSDGAASSLSQGMAHIVYLLHLHSGWGGRACSLAMQAVNWSKSRPAAPSLPGVARALRTPCFTCPRGGKEMSERVSDKGVAGEKGARGRRRAERKGGPEGEAGRGV
jgi:hypothetical protein